MVDKNIETITFNCNNDEEKHINIYNIDAIINGQHKIITVNKKQRKTIKQKLFKVKKPTKAEQNQLIKELIDDIHELKQKFKDVSILIKRNDEQKYTFLSGILKILSPALSTLERSIKN